MAIFNGGFPATYQPMYQPVQYQPVQYQMQQAQQQTQQTQPVQNSIIWVSGEAGAKSYLVAPNNSVVLFDSEAQSIYIKSADASGMPSMKVLDYTIRDTAPQRPVNAAINPSVVPTVEYADKAEQDALRAEITAYKGEMEALRADLESFRGDLYGIAGKKNVTRKKEAMEDE